MVVLELNQIEVDHCLTCKGVWLDAGELDLLLDGASNRGRLMDTLKKQSESSEKKIRCPICSKKMDKILCGDAGTICLDSCPNNHGIWFDKGELNEVIAMGDFPGDHRVYDLLREVFGDNR